MSRRSPASSIAIAMAAAILIAGCGGGDDDSSATTTTTTIPVITTTTVDPQADPLDPFCGTFDRVSEVIQLPQNTIEQARARAVQLTAVAAALAEVAPEELRVAITRLAAAAGELEVAAQAATTVEEAQAAELALQGDPEVVAANEALTAYLAESCGTG
jgi:hypothetical protein